MVSRDGVAAALKYCFENDPDDWPALDLDKLSGLLCQRLQSDSVTALLSLVQGHLREWSLRHGKTTEEGAGELVLYLAPTAWRNLFNDSRIQEHTGQYGLPNRICGIRVAQDSRLYREAWSLNVLSTGELLSNGAILEVTP